jgi:membrane fusion protein (multidrug efflux system)
VAPHGGTVAEVMTTVGSSIKEGDPVLKMVDKRMVATFKLSPGDAAGLKPKQPIAVAPQTGGGSAAAQVVSIDGGEVKVELLDDGGGAVKPGDAVQLVKSRIANVMPTPVTAVVKGAAGADQVFVLSNGVIHTRPVTVTDRTASEAYVSAGLTTGESVVVNPSSTLQDGQKAVVDQ